MDKRKVKKILWRYSQRRITKREAMDQLELFVEEELLALTRKHRIPLPKVSKEEARMMVEDVKRLLESE